MGIYKDLVLISWQYVEEIATNNDSLPKDAFDAIADVYSSISYRNMVWKESICNFEKVKLLFIQLHDSTFDSDNRLHGHY